MSEITDAELRFWSEMAARQQMLYELRPTGGDDFKSVARVAMPRLIAEVERLRDTVKQRDATAAEQSAAIERLREKLRVAEVRMREADEELEHVADALERYQPLTDSLETAVHKLVNALHAAEAEVERLRTELDATLSSASVQRMNDLHSETRRLIKELHETKTEVARLGSRNFDLSRKVSELEHFFRFIAAGPAQGVPSVTVRIGAATWDWIRKEFGQ